MSKTDELMSFMNKAQVGDATEFKASEGHNLNSIRIMVSAWRTHNKTDARRFRTFVVTKKGKAFKRYVFCTEADS